jgi:hypothetical protein
MQQFVAFGKEYGGSDPGNAGRRESEEIRRMGQWNISMFDSHYSCKLPLGPIGKLAGYNSDNKLYYNTRTIVMSDEALLRMTPIGKWCYDAYAAVPEEDPEGEHQNALQQVLRIFCELNTAFVQDMSAMIALHQDRQNHPHGNV